MSSKPKGLPGKLKKVIKTNCGCGESTQVVEPKSKSSSLPAVIPSSSTIMHDQDYDHDDGDDEGYTSTTFSVKIDRDHDDQREKVLCPQMVSRSPKITGSIAVVKDSNDPCGDFRRSMLQMIRKKGIYSEEDLQELLNCFLLMNSPSLHDIIIQAFTKIVSDVKVVSNKN